MVMILLVEDNEMKRDMLSRWLKRKGYEVFIAVDGQEGVNMATSESTSVILLGICFNKGLLRTFVPARFGKRHNYWNGQGVVKTSARHRNFIRFLRRNSSVCWSTSTPFRRLLLDNKAGITYKNQFSI